MIVGVLSIDINRSTHPPCNIAKTAGDACRISTVMAGFTAEGLSAEMREGALVVSASKPEEEGERACLHSGIAIRAFERTFHPGDLVRVTGARHADGMLHVELVRELPEVLNPRRIETARADRNAGEKDLIEVRNVT